MSFTASVKKEVAGNELKGCCSKAQCSALIKMCSTLNINAQGMYLTIHSESAPTAKKILKFLLKTFRQGLPRGAVVKTLCFQFREPRFDPWLGN